MGTYMTPRVRRDALRGPVDFAYGQSAHRANPVNAHSGPSALRRTAPRRSPRRPVKALRAACCPARARRPADDPRPRHTVRYRCCNCCCATPARQIHAACPTPTSPVALSRTVAGMEPGREACPDVGREMQRRPAGPLAVTHDGRTLKATGFDAVAVGSAAARLTPCNGESRCVRGDHVHDPASFFLSSMKVSD